MRALALLLSLFTLNALAQSAASPGRAATFRVSGTLYSSTVTGTSTSSPGVTITSSTAATGSADTAFKLVSTATLSSTQATDIMLDIDTGSTNVYRFYSGGRIQIQSQASNQSPGVTFNSGASGAKYRVASSGGSGEYFSIDSTNAVGQYFLIGGCNTTNCSTAIGPSSNGATPEAIAYKGTSGPAFQFNVGIRPARIALPTCAAGNEGMLVNDVAAGLSTGNATRVCMCQSDGAGTPAWAWKNIITGSAGNTTTCAN